MKLSKDTNILIVGLGLLGGSYAEALTKGGYTVNAVTKEQSSVDFALEKGIIKYGTTKLDESIISAADLVIFALYPHVFTEWIEKNQHLLKSGAVITDVTGVNYIVVPTEKNTAGAIELCRDLGEKLGFHRVAELSVEKHDEMIAFLSQLTHCIAVTLMCCNNTPDLEYYTGDSFRDLTRIARINDEMWSELFLDNRDMLLAEMRSFKQSFEELYEKIETGDRDGIREMMRLSTERRKRFNKHL